MTDQPPTEPRTGQPSPPPPEPRRPDRWDAAARPIPTALPSVPEPVERWPWIAVTAMWLAAAVVTSVVAIAMGPTLGTPVGGEAFGWVVFVAFAGAVAGTGLTLWLG